MLHISLLYFIQIILYIIFNFLNLQNIIFKIYYTTFHDILDVWDILSSKNSSILS